MSIGGTTKDALIQEAKLNLMNSRPLNKDEQYLNFVIDIKRSNFILFLQDKVTIPADVIKYSDSEKRYSVRYLNYLEAYKTQIDFYKIGDSIINDSYEGKILSMNQKRIRFSYIDEEGNFRTKKRPATRFFNKSLNYKNLQVGDTINYDPNILDISVLQKGVILGFKKDKLLIVNNLNEKLTLKYADLILRDSL